MKNIIRITLSALTSLAILIFVVITLVIANSVLTYLFAFVLLTVFFFFYFKALDAIFPVFTLSKLIQSIISNRQINDSIFSNKFSYEEALNIQLVIKNIHSFQGFWRQDKPRYQLKRFNRSKGTSISIYEIEIDLSNDIVFRKIDSITLRRLKQS